MTHVRRYARILGESRYEAGGDVDFNNDECRPRRRIQSQEPYVCGNIRVSVCVCVAFLLFCNIPLDEGEGVYGLWMS